MEVSHWEAAVVFTISPNFDGRGQYWLLSISLQKPRFKATFREFDYSSGA